MKRHHVRLIIFLIVLVIGVGLLVFGISHSGAYHRAMSPGSPTPTIQITPTGGPPAAAPPPAAASTFADLATLIGACATLLGSIGAIISAYVTVIVAKRKV